MQNPTVITRPASSKVVKYPEVREAYRNARRNAEPPISQERLAAEAGTGRRHIIKIENGEHRPTPALRDRIASVLGVDPSSLPAVEDAPPFAERTYGSGS